MRKKATTGNKMQSRLNSARVLKARLNKLGFCRKAYVLLKKNSITIKGSCAGIKFRRNRAKRAGSRTKNSNLFEKNLPKSGESSLGGGRRLKLTLMRKKNFNKTSGNGRPNLRIKLRSRNRVLTKLISKKFSFSTNALSSALNVLKLLLKRQRAAKNLLTQRASSTAKIGKLTYSAERALR